MKLHDVISSVRKVFMLISFILLSKICFANTSNPPKTLLSIRMHSWAGTEARHFSYILILPNNNYYSYYNGSNLPTWKVVHERIMQDKFQSEELVNIRIHPDQQNKNQISINKAYLILLDTDNLRIIWQGQLSNYDNSGKMNVLTELDNKKYYDSVVTVSNDQGNHTISFEIAFPSGADG